jgi:hypothetical protein
MIWDVHPGSVSATPLPPSGEEWAHFIRHSVFISLITYLIQADVLLPVSLGLPGQAL